MHLGYMYIFHNLKNTLHMYQFVSQTHIVQAICLCRRNRIGRSIALMTLVSGLCKSTLLREQEASSEIKQEMCR